MDFLDSSGIGILIALHRRLEEEGGHFAVSAPGPQPRQVLGLTATDRFLHVHPTLGDAVSSPWRRADR